MNEDGRAVGTGQAGLLMYDGGTVCDDGFDDIEAKAICRKMGFNRSSNWESGLFYDIQNSLDILLDNVDCEDEDWSTCSYSTTHNCGHSEDVFLTCVQGENFALCLQSVKFYCHDNGFLMHMMGKNDQNTKHIRQLLNYWRT